jgi:C1A family cysteine protease
MYGWVKDRKDTRDLVCSYKYDNTILPKKVNLIPKFPPCFNQHSTNSCVGNAVAAAVNYLDMSYGLSSRLYIYYNARMLDGTQHQDQGVQIRSAMKAVAKWGHCNESMWPFITLRVNVQPLDECYQEGDHHQVLEYARVEQSLDELKATLYAGYPIVFGMKVYASMEDDKVKRTGKVPMPKLWDRERGRHAVLIVGYDDSTQEFIVRNSWGTNWGLRGNFVIPYKFVVSPKYCADFWTIKEVEKSANV